VKVRAYIRVGHDKRLARGQAVAAATVLIPSNPARRWHVRRLTAGRPDVLHTQCGLYFQSHEYSTVEVEGPAAVRRLESLNLRPCPTCEPWLALPVRLPHPAPIVRDGIKRLEREGRLSPPGGVERVAPEIIRRHQEAGV
jgi:hypothetical protein